MPSLSTLVLFVILLWITRGNWIVLLSPYLSIINTHSELIQSIDAIVNISVVIINIVFVYLLWFRGRSNVDNTLTENPLTQYSIEQLLARLGQHGSKVPWIDRQAISISYLRRHNRIVISGHMNIGKTREAIEVIRLAIDNDLISPERIYQPSVGFRLLDLPSLRKSIESTMELQEPILLFMDDFPRYYFKGSLDLIDETINVLETCRDLYIVITARDEEITKEHSDWFQKQNFVNLRLGPLSKNQMTEFVNRASNALGVSIDRMAADIFVERSIGYPEFVLIGLRRVVAEKISKVTTELALEITHDSLVDSWLAAITYIQREKPAAIFILKSLDLFRVALVTPYPSMVLAYALHLWTDLENNKSIFIKNRQLKDALVFLRFFDFSVISGLILFPEIALDTNTTYTSARNIIGDFLTSYKGSKIEVFIRGLFHRTFEQSQCLFDIAYIAQGADGAKHCD